MLAIVVFFLFARHAFSRRRHVKFDASAPTFLAMSRPSSWVPLVLPRGTANFVVKWEGAKKQATANIVDIKKVSTVFTPPVSTTSLT